MIDRKGSIVTLVRADRTKTVNSFSRINVEKMEIRHQDHTVKVLLHSLEIYDQQ